ncbi:ABC transporter permease [Plantactinospora sp. GCM10030261]|uniref:ABC transporter permease n=1 Tax=Plantactinospora sp. GCM10030261 TaxID=3273420 RepID=UPI003612F3F2
MSTSTEPAATTPRATHPELHKPQPYRDLATRIGARYGLLVVWLLLIAVFVALNGDVFLRPLTAQTIASTKAVVAILALAALVPLVVGQFDLSVASQFGLAQALCAGLVVKQGLPAWPGVLVVLLVGAVFGVANGFLVAVARINAFVVTLATGTLAIGLTQWYTGGAQIIGSFPESFTSAGRANLAGVPLPFVYVLVLAAGMWVMLEYTRWGRRAYAIGGNARAALLSGVNVRRMTVTSFAVAGVVSAGAGALQVTILGAASPEVGAQFLLPAFAGVFLGAAALRPGRFNAWGTVIAVYFLATGIVGLQQLGAPFYIEQFFNGGALLIAVAVAQYSAERRRRAAAAKPG